MLFALVDGSSELSNVFQGVRSGAVVGSGLLGRAFILTGCSLAHLLLAGTLPVRWKSG